jgi:hypothetical protein
LELRVRLAQLEKEKAEAQLRLAQYEAEREEMERRMANLSLENGGSGYVPHKVPQPLHAMEIPEWLIHCKKPTKINRISRVSTLRDLMKQYQVTTNQMVWKLPGSSTTHWDTQCQHVVGSGKMPVKVQIGLNLEKKFCQTCLKECFN